MSTAVETVVEKFPIDLSKLKPLKLDPANSTLTEEQKSTLKDNIQLCRDAIVFFTALAGAKGLSGHTGGAYDTVPEVMIIRAFIENGTPIVPIFYDEAGHRVATQYLLSVLNGAMPAEKLLHYREYESGLPGHPEKKLTPGVEFSSGRLGHMWAFVNGVALAHPGKAVILLGSDGSQMEGDNAEAARLTVGKQLNVKILVDDNNVTIAGHPQEYMTGYDLSRTLSGYGLTTETTMGEDIDALYIDLCRAFADNRPHGLVIKRPMAPGIKGAEGSPHAHEVLKTDVAVEYLQARGCDKAVELLKAAKPDKSPLTFKGSSGVGKNRDDFGKIINEILDGLSEEERLASVRVFDNDLEGSCGLHHIRKAHPEVFVRGGIMERGNFSAAAGFGASEGKQGIYATFSAFLEMCISEITMSRLNFSNVLAHFSHSGVDDMADNTCHFGINSMYADGGVKPGHGGEDTTRLYFPVDQHQFAACVKRIYHDPGLRFLFTNRAPVPDILGEDGQPLYKGKPFEPGVDYVVREAKAGGGYVVAMGETVYRALDAVITLQESGTDVGLINKPTLNVIDHTMLKKLAAAPFVLVAEGWNVKTGLGSRFGSYLLEAGFKGKYKHIGVHVEGGGGLWQQMGHQGLDSEGIQKAIKTLL
ncbi:transketolase C-terminal domain-containing protein [Silvibacterium sp.]|uniref:transketolase C-terminal domain-containing protein n=1 Tax=Silvibacterium sp. TaxID=1964179 RepID=UPI0039E5403E